jgi:Mg2+ and Co2+ transporter CorA
MEKALAAITCDMSNKITELSAQMTSVVRTISEQSANSTREVLNHAEALTDRSAEQLTLLLKTHSEEMAKVDDLKTCLDTTLREFATSMKGYDQMTARLEKLITDVSTTVASLGDITKTVMNGQETAVELLSSSASQVESLKNFSQSQQEVLDHVGTSMVQYESVFQKVESHAKDLLAQIARHLGGYSTITEKHFNMLTTTADNFISQASGRLSGSIDELGEQLDELHNAVSKIAVSSQQMRQS